MPGLGAVDAQVEWQRGNLFGAKFLHPVDLARCDWAARARKPALAELLLERAAARNAGRIAAEQRLRAEILAALPMQRGENRRMKGSASAGIAPLP